MFFRLPTLRMHLWKFFAVLTLFVLLSPCHTVGTLEHSGADEFQRKLREMDLRPSDEGIHAIETDFVLTRSQFSRGLKLPEVKVGIPPVEENLRGHFYRFSSVTPPTSGIDWRQTAAITHVFNQGEARSCFLSYAIHRIVFLYFC